MNAIQSFLSFLLWTQTIFPEILVFFWTMISAYSKYLLQPPAFLTNTKDFMDGKLLPMKSNCYMTEGKNIHHVNYSLLGKPVAYILADFVFIKEGTKVLRYLSGFNPKSCGWREIPAFYFREQLGYHVNKRV